MVSRAPGIETAPWAIWAANNFEILTNYKIKVTSEIQDVIGKNLTNPYLSTFGFITEDNLKPEVVSTIPPVGAVDVEESVPISIEFSKPIDPAHPVAMWL